MASELVVEYDCTGDVLYLGKTVPYSEQESEEVEYGIIARTNPQSGEAENLEILFFSKRLEKGEAFRLPISAEFHLSEGV